jgi:hypothetical protein
MSKKSAAGLVAWAEQAYKDGWVYWYGTCGYACTQSLLTRKTNQYPDHYGDSRQAKYKKHIAEDRVCSDCIGLFKSYAWDKDGDIDTRESGYGANEQPDHGAKTTLNKCKVKGDISTMPEIPGLAVWTKTGGHIGLYVGNGEVIELRGFSYGCQRNKLNKRAFSTWGLYPYVEYTAEQASLAAQAANGTKTDNSPQKAETAQKTENKAESVVYNMKTLRVGNTGTQVKVLQWLLNHTTDYTSGVVDGIFGTKTLAAVRQFQQANGLTVDGIVGKKTWEKLLG